MRSSERVWELVLEECGSWEAHPRKDRFDVQQDGEAGWWRGVGSNFYSVHCWTSLHIAAGLKYDFFLRKHYLLTGGRERLACKRGGSSQSPSKKPDDGDLRRSRKTLSKAGMSRSWVKPVIAGRGASIRRRCLTRLSSLAGPPPGLGCHRHPDLRRCRRP